jgi:hypothetical protein
MVKQVCIPTLERGNEKKIRATRNKGGRKMAVVIQAVKNARFFAGFSMIIIALFVGCVETPYYRETVRVETEPIRKSAQLIRPDLIIRRVGPQKESIEIIIRKIVRMEVCHTNIDKVIYQKKEQKYWGKRPLSVSVFGWNCSYYAQIEKGHKKILTEQKNVPVKHHPVIIKINEYKKTVESDSNGKIMISLVQALKEFDINSHQLKIICSANIDGQEVSKEAFVTPDDTQKLYSLANQDKPRTIVPPLLEFIGVDFIDRSGDQVLDADETANLKINLINKGPGLGRRINLEVEMVNEFQTTVNISKTKVINVIGPGNIESFELPITAERDLPNGTLCLNLRAREANGFDSDLRSVTIPTRQFRKPKLVLSDYGISDNNENSQIEPLFRGLKTQPV